MTETLKKFAEWNNRFDTVKINDINVTPHFDGETCWERSHPTFISKKRKVILTCPRKVGHSSIRFYLHSQNEMFDDDWIWIEGDYRNPKSYLKEDEYKSLVESVYSENTRKVVIGKVQSHHTPENGHLVNAEILQVNSDRCIECFGDYNKWDYAKNVAPAWADKKEFDMTPPFQTLPIFDDWTSYLLVREPWDRFISGLITEMDNGIGSPWIYDNIANTEEGWEKYYTHAKRMLFFVDPEFLLVGGMDGQQMNHTFLLSRPMWEGKTMFDVYDKLIHYKHDIDYTTQEDGRVSPTVDSMTKSAGVIDSLIELGFIHEDVKKPYQQDDKENMHSHTHMNITPSTRQAVIKELEEDEDLKEWWDRCREMVSWDIESLKNNQHKF